MTEGKGVTYYILLFFVTAMTMGLLLILTVGVIYAISFISMVILRVDLSGYIVQNQNYLLASVSYGSAVWLVVKTFTWLMGIIVISVFTIMSVIPSVEQASRIISQRE
jgi:hypothetical protein